MRALWRCTEPKSFRHALLQDLNIEIVERDDCGVIYDLMAGSIKDPLLTSAATRTVGLRSLWLFGVALLLQLLAGDAWHR